MERVGIGMLLVARNLLTCIELIARSCMCLNRIRDPPGASADQFLTEAAVQLDIPMKESDLIQPKEVGCHVFKTKICCQTYRAAKEPDRTTYLVGFVPFAEQLNGRVQSSERVKLPKPEIIIQRLNTNESL